METEESLALSEVILLPALESWVEGLTACFFGVVCQL